MVGEVPSPLQGADSGSAVLPLESAIHSAAPEDLLRAAADPALNEDLALALLQRADLPTEVLEQLARNSNALKLRKLKLALACHPRAPRHVSVPLIRQFYSFDLMKVALMPSVPADVRIAADEALIARLKTVTLGERLGLARQGSGRLSGALLLDGEGRVIQAALNNSRLAEALVVRAVLSAEASAALVQAVSRHAKWSFRREVRMALLRTEYLSLARALEFTHGMPLSLLRDILHSSRLPARIKEHLLREKAEAQK